MHALDGHARVSISDHQTLKGLNDTNVATRNGSGLSPTGSAYTRQSRIAHRLAAMPPSTIISAPVTKVESSLAKNKAARAMSSPVPKRRIGV